jgi:uncharacterized delta-60 repeat protein
MVSLRFGVDGKLDSTWGTKNAVMLDVAGDNDRGRNVVVLPDDRVVIFGSGTPAPMNIDAMVLVLQANGAFDTTFDGDGYKLYDFGRPDEAFYGAALSPSKKWVASAGYRAGAVGGVAEDDDATLVLLPVAAGAGTELAKAVPLSETENDRFWGVTFDDQDRAYAAGFLRTGSDTQMVVARYTTAGVLDPTFGTGGVAMVNVSVAGGTEETARGVVVQSDGKVVIAGVVEHQ